MKLTFKKYFIPHEENEHKPHMLRTEKVLILLSLILLIETVFLAQVFLIGKNTNFLAAVISNVIIDKTNAERIEADLSSLSTNDSLELAAELKANDMAKKGYFAHVTPEGYDPWHWLGKADYDYVAAGENLAVNFTDSEDVVEAWMDSEGHRANILKEDFTEIGVATAKGEYKGREAIFVVQFFGTPAAVAVETKKPEVPQTEPIRVAETPTEEPTVASAQEEEPVVREKTFIQTKQIDPIKLAVANAGSTAKKEANILQQVASEPKTTANLMLLMLATIVALALTLKVFVKIKIQHPPLIVNGVLLLLIVSSTILANQYLSSIEATIS